MIMSEISFNQNKNIFVNVDPIMKYKIAIDALRIVIFADEEKVLHWIENR